MKRKTYIGLITHLDPYQIFVFGSNPEGRHGGGTAKIALKKYGAINGQGHGLQGQSYGLVTKNLRKGFYDPVTKITHDKNGLRSISKNQIIDNIKKLYKLARKMKNYEFLIAFTANGKNLNGYSSKEMAEMFYNAKPIPKNIIFENHFLELLPNS